MQNSVPARASLMTMTEKKIRKNIEHMFTNFHADTLFLGLVAYSLSHSYSLSSYSTVVVVVLLYFR
jgi:hypothetical protein